MRLVVGISGASGAIYGIRMLGVLKDLRIETHLILTRVARENIKLETDYKLTDVEGLATETHDVSDMASKLASGSFRTNGMVVIPCSMKTLSGIASGYSENLLLRAADVSIKERRPLVLVIREAPLSLIHIENMAAAARAGAVILPAMPAFYHRPKTLDEVIDQLVGKVLDTLGVEHNLYRGWEGASGRKRSYSTPSRSQANSCP